jgi:hypothetical protein
LLYISFSHRDNHPSLLSELFFKRGRDTGWRTGDNDRIERGPFRPAFVAITDPDLNVFIPQVF